MIESLALLAHVAGAADARSPLCYSALYAKGCVGAKLIGDHASERAALFLQQPLQQALGGLGVASALDDFIKHIAVLINRPPQPVFLAGTGDRDFVEMPDIATVWFLTPEATSVTWPKLQNPVADGL